VAVECPTDAPSDNDTCTQALANTTCDYVDTSCTCEPGGGGPPRWNCTGGGTAGSTGSGGAQGNAGSQGNAGAAGGQGGTPGG